ncbi:hypothetical protein D3C87_1941790 [compost metagenome]
MIYCVLDVDILDRAFIYQLAGVEHRVIFGNDQFPKVEFRLVIDNAVFPGVLQMLANTSLGVVEVGGDRGHSRYRVTSDQQAGHNAATH